MHRKKRNELCKKVNSAALKYKHALESANKDAIDLAQKELDESLQEMRLLRLSSIAKQVATLYPKTVLRSESPELFSQKVLEKLKTAPDNLLSYVRLIADALRETKLGRTDKPFHSVGMYDTSTYTIFSPINNFKEFKNGLSYSGIIVRAAFESYVYSLLGYERLSTAEMFYLDFPSNDIKASDDETSKLFKKFVELLAKSEITEEDLHEFDENVANYSAQRSIGIFESYSDKGQEFIGLRGTKEDFYETCFDVVKEFSALEEANANSSSFLVTLINLGKTFFNPPIQPNNNAAPNGEKDSSKSSAPSK